MAEVIFNYEEIETIIKCSIDSKMKDIIKDKVNMIIKKMSKVVIRSPQLTKQKNYFLHNILK